MAFWFRKKVEVTCPSCGVGQQECRDYLSTICRACGYAFSRLEAESPRAHPLLLPPTEKTAESDPLEIPVTCHRCGTTHQASPHSLSTRCSGCQTAISFSSEVINRPLSRQIDTRGDLLITKTGSLFGPHTVCRHATIQGKISGAIYCEGKLLLQTNGTLPCKIHAEEVLVPGGSDVACPFPIEARLVVVRGILRAHLFLNGTLKILRKGRVEGSVLAKSIQVDRGGQLLGQVHISPRDIPASPTSHSRSPALSLQTARKIRPQPRRIIY
jgi:cytoskeletal protein CcmA (bactofilin family)